MIRKLFFALSLICIVNTVQSQTAKTSAANTLLWRISGNGLNRPSYLYGTMHLTDKRVFQLGDSVYQALERTDGFAAELDMNTVGIQMINYFVKQQEEKAATEPVMIKDVVAAEIWDEYKVQLEKKFGKKAEKITLNDLEELEKGLQSEIFRKGDMPTFLDAWLSGQARRQGKWIGGIEDFEDQLEHMADIESKIQLALFDDDYYRKNLEWLIKIYTRQQLDTIDAYMYREENGRKDYIMVKRNIKMARRMDSLLKIRSMFFAVGAAHLPGDSGVITLLRQRGFTVSPVGSSKTISADKYNSKVMESAWTSVNVTDSLYTLQMPGAAQQMDVLSHLGLDMKLYFDLSFMKMYMTMGLDVPEDRAKLGADSLYRSIKKQYTSRGKIQSEKQVVVNGFSGREFRITTIDGAMLIQVFFPGMRYMVLNAVFAFREKSLEDNDAIKFFQSFVFNEKARPRPVTKEKIWTRIECPVQSFSVEMPGKPREKKDVISEEGKIMYEWQTIDITDQIVYGISVAAMKEGMYDSGSDSAYFTGIKDRLKESFTDVTVRDSGFLTFHHYPAYRVVIDGKSDGDSIVIKILALKRGGLSYYLYGISSPATEGSKMTDRFLNSFQMLPYAYPEWKSSTPPGTTFSAMTPFPLKKKELNEDDLHPSAERYIVYDTMAFVTTYIDRTVFPDWFGYSSDTGFLRYRSGQYASLNDSIAGYTLEKTGSLQTVSFVVLRPGDDLVKRVKLVLNGDELYELFGNFSRHDLAVHYDRFFNGFRVLKEKPGWERKEVLTEKLAAAIQNADAEKIKLIKHWWEGLAFSQKDIPLLQSLLLKIYPDFDSTGISNMNAFLFDRIEWLDSNHTTLDFIRKNYGMITPANEFIKPLIIRYLTGLQTEAAFRVLKECLVNFPVNTGEMGYVSHSLYDSLALTAILYPEVMKQASSASIWTLIAGTATSLLDSNLLSDTAIKQYGSYFITTARRVLNGEKEAIEEGKYYYTDLIRILGIINTPESDALLTRFAKFKNPDIRFRTMIAMLESDMPVQDNVILGMAASDQYRHDLYDELKRLNKLKRFPQGFLSQKELGRSKLFVYASEDEYELNHLSHLGERIVFYKGQKQKFHLYKVIFTGEETALLGVAGPYSLTPGDLSSNHEATGLYWEEDFNLKQVDKMLKEYLLELEEE